MKKNYLECEKFKIFLVLIFITGFFGAYTLTLKGGVFCNAQSVNIAYFGIAIGSNNYAKANRIFLSITAYFLGILLSEHTAYLVSKTKILRWDTLVIGFEIVIVSLLATLFKNSSDIIFQTSISFMCALLFNTFRQAEGVAMPTTLCTAHLRQFGSYLIKYIRQPNKKNYLHLSLRHLYMILSFTLGCMCCGFLGMHFKSQALLFVLIPLIYVFIDLLIADLTIEKKYLGNKIPKGH